MDEWYTPRQLARLRHLRTSKVMGWIATGELRAVNFAAARGGRPRWRISLAALEAFELARTNRAVARQIERQMERKAERGQRRKEASDVIRFF